MAGLLDLIRGNSTSLHPALERAMSQLNGGNPVQQQRQPVQTQMTGKQGPAQLNASAPALPQAPTHNQLMAGIPKQYKPDQEVPTTGGFAGGTTPQTIAEAQKMTESQMGVKPNAGFITSQADLQKAAQWNQQLQANAKYITDKKVKFQQDAAKQAQTKLTIEALGETMSPSQKTLYEAGFETEVAKQLLSSPAATSAMKNAQAIGFKPGSPEYIEFIQGSVKPASTTVEIINEGNKVWRKTQADNLSGNIKRHREGVAGNRDRLDKLNRLQGLFGKLETSDGVEGSLVTRANQFANSLGLDVDFTGQANTLDQVLSVTNSLVADELNKATGAQTDSDRNFLQTIIPNMDQNKAARSTGLSYMKSRIMLDDAQMNTLSDVTMLPTLEASQQAYNVADKAYRNVPAGVVLADGSTVTFSQYYDSIGQPDMKEGITRWMQAIADDKKEAKK